MKKKSLFAVVVAAMMMLTLTACSDDGDVVVITTPPQVTNAPTTTPAPTDADTTPEDTSAPEDTTASEGDDDGTTPEDTTAPDGDDDDTTSEDTTAPDSGDDDTTPEDTTPAETTEPENTDPPAPSNPSGIAATANAQLGIDFVMNACSPEVGFDNSGLIYYVLNANGVTCPRFLDDQMTLGNEIGLDAISSGDLVFFKDGGDTFGGIYVGDDTFVYAPYPGKQVRTGNLSSAYWQSIFIKGVDIG